VVAADEEEVVVDEPVTAEGPNEKGKSTGERAEVGDDDDDDDDADEADIILASVRKRRSGTEISASLRCSTVRCDMTESMLNAVVDALCDDQVAVRSVDNDAAPVPAPAADDEDDDDGVNDEDEEVMVCETRGVGRGVDEIHG
jgi:hypothetical protein